MAGVWDVLMALRKTSDGAFFLPRPWRGVCFLTNLGRGFVRPFCGARPGPFQADTGEIHKASAGVAQKRPDVGLYI